MSIFHISGVLPYILEPARTRPLLSVRHRTPPSLKLYPWHFNTGSPDNLLSAALANASTTHSYTLFLHYFAVRKLQKRTCASYMYEISKNGRVCTIGMKKVDSGNLFAAKRCNLIKCAVWCVFIFSVCFEKRTGNRSINIALCIIYLWIIH